MIESVRGASRPIWIFLVFLCVFSSAADILIIHNHHHQTASLSRFVMWCPGLAALVTCVLLRIRLAGLGWRWPALRDISFAYFLPILYATPVYVLTWITVRGSFSFMPFAAGMTAGYGLQSWPVLGTFSVAVPLLFVTGVIGSCTWALGEELGWRGFLFPKLLERFGFYRACLLSGALWAVWHYPSLLGADYNSGTNPWFSTVCFTVMVIAMAFIMGHLRVRSNSVWPCVLFHAAHNTFIQGIFDPLTTTSGWAKYITSEFGVGLAAAMMIAAVIASFNSRCAFQPKGL